MYVTYGLDSIQTAGERPSTDPGLLRLFHSINNIVNSIELGMISFLKFNQSALLC